MVLLSLLTALTLSFSFYRLGNWDQERWKGNFPKCIIIIITILILIFIIITAANIVLPSANYWYLGILHVLVVTHIIFITTLWSGYYHPYLTDEGTEAQRGHMAVKMVGFELHQSDSRLIILTTMLYIYTFKKNKAELRWQVQFSFTLIPFSFFFTSWHISIYLLASENVLKIETMHIKCIGYIKRGNSC